MKPPPLFRSFLFVCCLLILTSTANCDSPTTSREISDRISSLSENELYELFWSAKKLSESSEFGSKGVIYLAESELPKRLQQLGFKVSVLTKNSLTFSTGSDKQSSASLAFRYFPSTASWWGINSKLFGQSERIRLLTIQDEAKPLCPTEALKAVQEKMQRLSDPNNNKGE